MGKESSSLDSNYNRVHIGFSICPETNRLLTESAQRSNRTKKSEAELRLADHLRRFRSISEIGDVTPF